MWRVKLPFMTDPPGMRPQGVSDGFWPVFGERATQDRAKSSSDSSFVHPTPVPAGTCIETGKSAGGRASRIAQTLPELRVTSKLYSRPCKSSYGTNTVLIGAQR